MTKHEKKDDLDKKLKQAEHKQENKKQHILEEKILQLEKEKSEFEGIARRAQHDYINLKTDFDRYQRQVQESTQAMELNSLFAVVKKFLPFLEDLRKSLENIPEEHQEDPLAKGVQIVYNKFLKVLEGFHISAIESLGLVPDSFLHEPVSVEPTEDKKMKGKIIREFERGFVYMKDGEQKVIIASKVIVGQ